MTAAADVSDAQRETVGFLEDVVCAKPPRKEGARIDTHGAHVFLGDGEVFKIKRAVSYSYMDFSTPEKRHAALLREFEVNSPNAPDIYKDVVAITREPDGRLALGGTGTPVEWALRMARFDEASVLCNRIKKSPLSPQEAKALADIIADAHRGAAVITSPPLSASLVSIAENLLAALPQLFAGHDGERVAELANALRPMLQAVQPLLQRRVASGHVRRCHGDLHLGNIVLLNGRPTLFDAIEFDEAIATVDTLFDLAFLLMDLDHAGRRDNANLVFNRYLWRRQDVSDLDALAALPVFLALRAAVRAMVIAQRARLSRADVSASALPYLERACGYLKTSETHLILIGGLSGSGKSTLAAALAPSVGRAPGAFHLRSDLERKAVFHKEEFDRLGEKAYTRDVTAQVYDVMLTKARAALSAGHSVILDAVHADEQERRAAAALAPETGAQLATFWLDVPAPVMRERVSHRVADASDATPQVLERQLAYDLGALEWTRIDASGRLEETLRKAMSHLHARIG